MRKRPSCGIVLSDKTPPSNPRIVVAGAGAIGCFVGGLSVAVGRDVTFLVRPRIAREIRAHGLSLTDFTGFGRAVPAEDLVLTEDPACLGAADIILVCVKSHDTGDMAALIAKHASVGTTVISLQNGTENAPVLRAALPDMQIGAGMVPFNVVPLGQGGFHRATSGNIAIEGSLSGTEAHLSAPGLLFDCVKDIAGLQWGKLLVNLNNALNALSGLTLSEQLRNREWRLLMAAQWREALGVMKAHDIAPRSFTPLPVAHVPMVLRLPTFMFTKVAAQMLTIDPQARTSMSYDLMYHRPTEIDALQGQVVRMGAERGQATPIAAAVLEVVKLASLAREGLPNLSAKAIWREIKAQHSN